MSQFKVLVTDYAWPNLFVEKEILSQIDAEPIIAEQQDVETLTRLASDVDAIMTCWANVPQQVIASSPRLRIVARFGIGLDNIDVESCTRRGIVVTNVPDYCQVEVAEHALALLMSLARKTAFFHSQTKQGVYNRQAGPALRRLEGQTLGIVGLGGIGRCLATKAQAIGLKVIGTSRTCHQPLNDVEFCELDELLSRSDYVSLNLSLTAETVQIIGAPELAKMKPTAYLINTARGDLIDHAALADALDNNRLAGAALDVQSPEPPNLAEAPYNDPRVIVTPHAAFLSVESLEELRKHATRQVAACLSGLVPDNVVNSEVLP